MAGHCQPLFQTDLLLISPQRKKRPNFPARINVVVFAETHGHSRQNVGRLPPRCVFCARPIVAAIDYSVKPHLRGLVLPKVTLPNDMAVVCNQRFVGICQCRRGALIESVLPTQ